MDDKALKKVDIVWNTVRGSWKVEGNYRESFKGRDYKPVSTKMGSVTTDSAGNFQATFTVPEGFGFQHVENFRVPQLTVDDHPGEKLPALHFAFQVTGP